MSCCELIFCVDYVSSETSVGRYDSMIANSRYAETWSLIAHGCLLIDFEWYSILYFLSLLCRYTSKRVHLASLAASNSGVIGSKSHTAEGEAILMSAVY